MNNRRKLLKFLPFIMAGTLSYPVGKFIFFSEKKDEVFLISLKNIKDGVTEVKKHNLFIFKKGKDIKVLNAHCTHMGCLIHFYKDKQRFICPCHHSQFTIDGHRIKGPAQRDLDKIAFKIENKKLLIG